MAFSTTGTSSGSLSSEINVAPLIDVLLVMLIILMVIVPVMPRGLHSSLPSPAVPGVAEAADRQVLIEVQRGQMATRYLVDGLAVERAEVASRLLELRSRRSVLQVIVKADPQLDFGVIAGVIDAGRSAGLALDCLHPELMLRLHKPDRSALINGRLGEVKRNASGASYVQSLHCNVRRRRRSSL